jgi:hypothetical protein
MEEFFLKTGNRLFVGNQLPNAVAEIRADIERRIAATSDDALLEADADAWAEGLAEELGLDPPVVDVDHATLHPGDRVDIDCTKAPGIDYTSSEWGHVVREGYEFELRVPASGDTYLLGTQTLGAPALPAGIRGDAIVCEWHWPDVKGSEAFEHEVGTFKSELRRSVEVVAGEVEAANAGLAAFAIEQIEARRSAILAQRDFLGALTIPLVKDDEEPKAFDAPPPIERRQTPAQKIDRPDAAPPERELGPQLDEFYEHILGIIRAVGRGLERSPGSFADADEEALRDQMLVTLNTHYRGAAYAEAFNSSGKTDILIRVYDRNAFIGECKWWTGPKAMVAALEQLFGYTTWQDSRVALIFYVPTKDIAETIAKAKATLGEQDELLEWLEGEGEAEARCRIHWPGDPKRVATLTALFVHLPRQS